MPLIEELPDDYSEPPPGAWQCSEFASEFEFYEGTEAWDEQAQWDEQDCGSTQMFLPTLMSIFVLCAFVMLPQNP